MWNKKTWLKTGPICLQPERQRQYCVSFFFPLTFDAPALGFCILDPVSCFKTDACCWFWFIYPLLHTRALEVSTGPVLGGVWVRVCGFACGERDDVSFTVWVKTDVLKTVCMTQSKSRETLCSAAQKTAHFALTTLTLWIVTLIHNVEGF